MTGGAIRMHYFSAALVGLLACFFVLTAQAETIRCDGHIIEKGMSQDSLREKCGSPDSMHTETHYYWVYKRGDKNVRIYFYNNGDIEKIETHFD